jgi:hypothetical protein
MINEQKIPRRAIDFFNGLRNPAIKIGVVDIGGQVTSLKMLIIGVARGWPRVLADRMVTAPTRGVRAVANAKCVFRLTRMGVDTLDGVLATMVS